MYIGSRLRVTCKACGFLLSVILLSGCRDDDPEGVPPESKIIVEVREILAEGSGNIVLYAETEKIYPCINYEIAAERIFLADNGQRVTYTGVNETQDCYPVLGRATSSVDFGALSNGTYSLELNTASLKNAGTVTVTNSEITLTFESLKGIEIARYKLMRVPPQTYWGSVSYVEETRGALVDAFLDRLDGLGVVFQKQSPGDYWYYQIDEDGDIEGSDNGVPFTRYVIFQFSGDETALKELIRSAKNPNEGGYVVHLTTYKGEQINNWSD